jgi:hypothetical protein
MTEFAQVSQSADWWPPTVRMSGMIGGGILSQEGTVSEKVACVVAKKGPGLNNSSDPVLLWEQAEIHLMVYFEY